MVLAHLDLNMALMRAVLYQRLNVSCFDLRKTFKNLVYRAMNALLTKCSVN
jgi:hypothetical protein